MKERVGTTGLILNEPLLWEKGKKGRRGYSLPMRDVESSSLSSELIGEGPDFPDLSEVDVVRHYTRLSQWNYGIDSGLHRVDHRRGEQPAQADSSRLWWQYYGYDPLQQP